MKRLFSVVFFISTLLLILSCSKRNEKSELPESIGKINTISLIINDQLWDGEVGDSLRKKLAAPVDGLPQEEPIFTINQCPTKVLEGRKALHRNIIVVGNDNEARFEIIKNRFAKPQNLIYISGSSAEEINSQIEQNADSIIKIIERTEIAENQNLFKKSLLNDKRIQKKFNISLLMPSTYKRVMNKPNFIWLKKEILSGNNSILIYKVPMDDVLKDKDYVNNIIKIRDYIGARYIHGKLKNTRMITEESYSPYFQKTAINGKLAFETKGTWELKGDFMSGSFISYAVMNPKRKECIIIEGFCYAPSTDKRDLMHELKSIINSMKVIN